MHTHLLVQSAAREEVLEGVRNVAAGANVIDRKRGIERGLHVVIDRLRGRSRPVASPKERVHVATIATLALHAEEA